MPNRCVAGRCPNIPRQGVTLHAFPKQPERQAAWLAFVHVDRPNWTLRKPSRAHLCSEHFAPSCFINRQCYQLGHSSHLLLHPDAVPTVRFSNQRTAEGGNDGESMVMMECAVIWKEEEVNIEEEEEEVSEP